MVSWECSPCNYCFFRFYIPWFLRSYKFNIMELKCIWISGKLIFNSWDVLMLWLSKWKWIASTICIEYSVFVFYPQSGVGSALEISTAIQPEDIHEAMRRYHHCIGPFSSHIVSVFILATFLPHACTWVDFPPKNIPVYTCIFTGIYS